MVGTVGVDMIDGGIEISDDFDAEDEGHPLLIEVILAGRHHGGVPVSIAQNGQRIGGRAQLDVTLGETCGQDRQELIGNLSTDQNRIQRVADARTLHLGIFDHIEANAPGPRSHRHRGGRPRYRR